MGRALPECRLLRSRAFMVAKVERKVFEHGGKQRVA